MRKLYIALCLTLFTVCLRAQVSNDIKVYLSLDNPNLDSPGPGSLVNHDTIYCSNPGSPIICRLQYVNTSAIDTYEVALQRYIITEGASTSSAMTYGAINYPPGASTTLATTNAYNDTLDAELDCFPGDLGTFTYVYHFFNTSDSLDFVDITVRFISWEGIEEYSNLSGSIYPNPCIGEINIELKESLEKGELIIFDMNGKKCISRHFTNENKWRVSTENLAPGNYWFIILNDDRPKYRGSFIRE
jgi:hypothetical protein